MAVTAAPATLRVNEIFFSLQGETSRVGLPTVFVRLTGCPLRCTYCDTEYAFHEGTTRSIEDILARVAEYPARHVCVTGGEPLAQKHCATLVEALCDAGYDVSIETSGALDISALDPRVSRVVDIKTPGSGEVDKNRWDNVASISARDEIKFVLCSESDYLWARDIIAQYQLTARAPVLFSPANPDLKPAELAGWILRDALPVRMQVQLHKILWGDARGR